MKFYFKIRRKSVLFYLILILFIIALKTNSNLYECVNQIIVNEIKLRQFVSNESRLWPQPEWSPLIDERISTYSAFLTEESFVKITSAVDQDLWSQNQIQIECNFMISKKSSVKFRSKATLKILKEDYFGYKRYAVSQINCFLPLKYHSFVNYVGISLGSDPSIKGVLKISKTGTYYTRNSSLDTVVCIRPVFHSKYMLPSIIEFFAYYRSNQINKFVFYDLDIDPYLRSFLTSLEFIEIIPFKMKISFHSVHAFGQMAALNDCLLRYSTSPIIFVDIDEFIVIQNQKSTIQSLIEQQMKNTSLSSVVINNRFLCHEFQTNHSFPLILNHKRIQNYYWRPGDRSKFIVLRPNTIIDTSIHNVLHTKSGYYSQELDDSQVLLYHMRSCCGLNQEFVHFQHLNLYFKTIKDHYNEDNRIKWFEPEINQFINKYVEDYQNAQD